ncbi:MAG: hypothetical protein K0R63_342 [Rickettsiales bacterium]|jgi:hypothetical protein|nr:hypothetical protein [Rickettsiales bacterium]
MPSLHPKLLPALREILFTPVEALYSKRPYMRAVWQEKGYGLSYLLLLSILSWGVVVEVWSGRLKEMSSLVEQGYQRSSDNASEKDDYRRFILDMGAQLPPIHVKEQNFSITEPMPYVIKDSVTGKPLLVIDTRQADVDWESTETPLFLTNKRLLLRADKASSGNIVGLFDVTEWPGQELTVDIPQILSWLKVVEASRHVFWLWGVGTSWVFGVMFACFFAAILRYTLLPLFVQEKDLISYPAALRAACVALTPSVWMNSLMLLFPVLMVVPLMGTFTLSLPIIYLIVIFKGGVEEST